MLRGYPNLESFWQGFFVPAVDILVVAYLIYRVLLLVRGTRAAPMLGGLGAVAVLFFISDLGGLSTLHWILGNFLSSIIIVVIVIFQEEIRRGLTKVGLHPIFRRTDKTFYTKMAEDIALVSQRLAERKIGALVVIQREVGLEDFVEEAVELDARFSRKLLFSLFVKDSPLHDGAVVIVGNRIKAAGCVLPLSFNPDLDPNLGTRHRAALGLSERSDAVVVVVSEETGALSLTRDGKISRNLDSAMLKDVLEPLLAESFAVKETVTEAV